MVTFVSVNFLISGRFEFELKDNWNWKLIFHWFCNWIVRKEKSQSVTHSFCLTSLPPPILLIPECPLVNTWVSIQRICGHLGNAGSNDHVFNTNGCSKDCEYGGLRPTCFPFSLAPADWHQQFGSSRLAAAVWQQTTWLSPAAATPLQTNQIFWHVFLLICLVLVSFFCFSVCLFVCLLFLVWLVGLFLSCLFF